MFAAGASASAAGSSFGERVALETSRPAFYALRSGGWRDYVTLLHPPYTAWHLSYVAIGAALSAQISWSRFLPTLAAFFLAVGVGAHALDELNGRPLRTEIPRGVLVFLAAASIAGAVAIGIVGAVRFDPWIAAFVLAGAFIVVAYNLESFGGRFHDDAWFAVSWGSFPLLTAYFATAESMSAAALAGAVFAFALSLAQRVLSTQVREMRRRVRRVEGTIDRGDGSREDVTVELIMGPAERGLRILSVAVVALACSLVMMRVW
jgi:hypothetical protein